MSTEQERIDAHRAAAMAWAHRIPAVLASPDAARALALDVVAHMIELFTPTPSAGRRKDGHRAFSEAIGRVREVYERARPKCAACHGDGRVAWDEPCTDCLGTGKGEAEPTDYRAEADHLGAVLYPRDAGGRWSWQNRIPYEVCEALRRACEDERVLCGGAAERCDACHGLGYRIFGNPVEGYTEQTCSCQSGPALEPTGPVTPPLLALLLHDAAALLVDLRADLEGLESLVREAEARERARTKGSKR